MSINYSSPSNKNPRVFSKSSLINLIETWNENKDDKIKFSKNDSIKKLSDSLNQKMKPICDDKQYWCWTGVLTKMTNNEKTKKIIEMIESRELKPEMPQEWAENPIEWLSNYDIEDVMIQYSNNTKYKYAFLGVFPIDFVEEDKFGRCLYSHLCSIDMQKYINKKINYLGLITNMDKHDQSGSHWTSTFIIIDPLNKSYGAHYYDSVARPIPLKIKKFIYSVKNKLKLIYPKSKFRITYNNKKHQKKILNVVCFLWFFK